MSYKDFVTIGVDFDKNQYSINESVTGELQIKNNSRVSLDLENIQVKLILKHQGKGETDVVELDGVDIKEHKVLLRNGTITSQFSFRPIYNVTYNGYNVTQSILISTKVNIKKESERVLRNEKLSNFKILGYLGGVFKPDFYYEAPLTVEKGEANYQITRAEGSVRPGIRNSVIALAVGSIICIVLSVIAHTKFESRELLYGILAGYLLLLTVVYFFKLGPSLSIGKIDFYLKNLEGNLYEINLVLEKQSNIISEISYQLIGKEIVTYNNGSSRSTAAHTFFESAINKMKGHRSKYTDEANLPTKSLPISIKNNDFEIRWLFKLRILTKTNLKLNGTARIEIAYEDLIKG